MHILPSLSVPSCLSLLYVISGQTCIDKTSHKKNLWYNSLGPACCFCEVGRSYGPHVDGGEARANKIGRKESKQAGGW